MKTTRFIFFISSIVFMQACATLNQDECLQANWFDLGYEDGLLGYSQTRISKHRKACAKHGVTPNLSAYAQGH